MPASPPPAERLVEPARQVSADGGPRKRPKDRADRILAAAAQLFRERGYHATGIDEIGQAVGITGPAVYRHFPNKEALLIAAAEESVGRLHAAFAEDAERAGSSMRRVDALVATLMATALDNVDITAVYIREARHIPSERRQKIRRMQLENARIWTLALRDVRPEFTDLQCRFLLQCLGGLALSPLYFQAQLPRRDLEDVLTRMGIAAVLSDEVAANLRPMSDPGRPRRRSTDARPGAATSAPLLTRRSSRREMILSAAVRLFWQHGFSGVGMGDIAAAVGIGGPGVYRYFRDKEDILAAAFNRASEHLAASAARALSASTPSDALGRMVESYVDITIESADLVAVYMTESHALPRELQAEVRRGQLSYVDDWMLALREVRPDIEASEARLMVRGAMGIINSYAHGRAQLPGEDVRPLLMAMASSALLQA